jgi:hypothetical protein
VIAGHDHESFVLEVAMGEILATASNGLRQVLGFTELRLAQRIEKRADHLITFSRHSIVFPRIK